MEAVGLEALDADAVPPGVHQQLVRVLSELVSNTARYAAPGGARLVVGTDGRSLRAVVSNAVPAAGPGESDAPVLPGLGLTGARRRVESLGGAFDVARAPGRWTVSLSVPLPREVTP